MAATFGQFPAIFRFSAALGIATGWLVCTGPLLQGFQLRVLRLTGLQLRSGGELHRLQGRGSSQARAVLSARGAPLA